MVYIILIICSFLAAFISGVAGFGGALLLLPVITMCVGPEVSVPILTIAQLIGNLSRMAFGFKQIKWKPVFLFLVLALPLSALGALGFSILPKDIVTRCIGAVLIVMVILKMTDKIEFKEGTKKLVLGGGVVGLLSGLAGSAGPIGAAIFLSLDLAPVSYIASEATTATAMHMLKVIVYGKLVSIDVTAITTGLMMGVAMVLGTFFANRIIKDMSKDRFQKYVAILLCVVGMYMILFGG